MSTDISNKNKYELLEVKEYSTNSEITENYNRLKAKYSEERFLPGEAGNYAADMLGAIENAYVDIMTERRAEGFKGEAKSEPEFKSETTKERVSETVKPEVNSDSSSVKDYSDVDKLIKAGRIDDAQQALDQYEERHAEWHYLQAVIYYKKNWGNECKKQMEIALMKDPANAKYKDSYDKLCKEMEFKSKSFTSGNEANQNEQPKYEYTTEEKQLGGNDCMNSCCECLACNMLLNCCCNCH